MCIEAHIRRIVRIPFLRKNFQRAESKIKDDEYLRFYAELARNAPGVQ